MHIRKVSWTDAVKISDETIQRWKKELVSQLEKSNLPIDTGYIASGDSFVHAYKNENRIIVRVMKVQTYESYEL